MDKLAEAKKAVKKAHEKLAEAVSKKNKKLEKQAADYNILDNIKGIGLGTITGGGIGAALSALADYLAGNQIDTNSLLNSALLGALAGGGLTTGYKAINNGIIPNKQDESWPVAFGNTMASSMIKHPLTYTGAATGAYGSYRMAAKPIIRESALLEELANTPYKTVENLRNAAAKAMEEAINAEEIYRNALNNNAGDIGRLRSIYETAAARSEQLQRLMHTYRRIPSKAMRLARMGGAMAIPAATIGLGYLLDKILFSRD